MSVNKNMSRLPVTLSAIALVLASMGAQAASVTDEDILNDATITKQIVTNGLGTKGQRYSPLKPRHLAALLQSTTDRLERVAATTEYLANRGEGITRVAEQVANLGERSESLRTTLQNIENDRTADLRHELRIIARLLAQRPIRPEDVDHAPSA